MSNRLGRLVNSSPSQRRENLKKQYLSNPPSGTSERDRALDHLSYLVEFSRRLNIIECRGGNQPMPKPSALRESDLLTSVLVCAESIRENTFLQEQSQFRHCWIAFEKLLARVESGHGSESFFEAAYLLLFLAAVILKRYIIDGAVEKEPPILSLETYKSLTSGFDQPLFGSVETSSSQLSSLASNLRQLSNS